jgi:Methyltransferase domain
MTWWHAVVESEHEIQNPTSPEKIRLLGERLRLGPETQVLDVASGKCGPAVILAREFGCRVTAIERAPEFVAAARERVAAAGLSDRVEIVKQDAAEADLGRDRYDVAMCLGASFVWDGLEGHSRRSSRRHGTAARSWSASPTGAGGRYRTESTIRGSSPSQRR